MAASSLWCLVFTSLIFASSAGPGYGRRPRHLRRSNIRCGGDLTGNSGVIQSPGFPLRYPDEANCEWKISVNDGSRITLTFVDFEIETSNNCEFDSLEIYNGETRQSANQVAKLCGDGLPGPIVSSGSDLFLRFHSDFSVAFKGFKLEFTKSGCSRTFRGENGLIQSPNHPSNHPESLDCSFLICVPKEKLVILRFTHFDLEPAESCSYDYVEIFDGKNTGAPNLGKYCGGNMPAPIRSSTNELFLKFVSDETISHTGFAATYTAESKVHGGWSSWYVLTPCNVTCANGTEILSRNCTNPEPKHGGTPCQGAEQKEQACTLKPCPIDGGWSSWSEWNHCSTSCGPGFQQRFRNCSQPTPRYGGKTCPGATRKNRWCYLRPCPVHGSWSTWSLWSTCDKSCGTGVRARIRFCTNPPPFYGKGCGNNHYESKECMVKTCPVHGGWNPWGSWTACGKTCGGGVRERTRFCTNPPPYHGGKGCGSHYYESKECAANKCPVHGGWSNWSNWTECSVTCGAGVRTRERNCDNPVPAYGGTLCEGIYKDKKSCSTGEVCVAEVGCYKSFASDRLGNFTDEIQWSGHFSSQMQRIVKKCAHLAVKKRKRFFAVEDFGNCYGAQNFPSGSESKATRCIFGVGVKSYYFVYEAL